MKRIEDEYIFDKEIGLGTFSKVLKATHKKTNQQVAIKLVDKTVLSAKQRDRVYNEIDILSKCKHPNIINLREHFEDFEKIYLVMDL